MSKDEEVTRHYEQSLDTALQLLKQWAATEPVAYSETEDPYQCLYCESQHNPQMSYADPTIPKAVHQPECPWVKTRKFLEKVSQ